MKCTIRGEKIKITKAINNYVEEKLSILDKYFKRNDIDAGVLIKLKGKKQAIEVTIPYDNHILRVFKINFLEALQCYVSFCCTAK